MNDAGWTAQEILSVLARERVEVLMWSSFGVVAFIAALLLWAHWPCIMGRISWRD